MYWKIGCRIRNGFSALLVSHVSKSASKSASLSGTELTPSPSHPPPTPRYSKIDFVRYGFTALLVNQFEHKHLRLNDEPVLQFYGVEHENKWAALAYTSLFFVGFSFLSFIALKYVRHNKR